MSDLGKVASNNACESTTDKAKSYSHTKPSTKLNTKPKNYSEMISYCCLAVSLKGEQFLF